MKIGLSRILIILAVISAFFITSNAYALDQRFNIERFRPAMDKYGLITVDTSEMHKPLRFGTDLYFHFIDGPLEYNVPQGTVDLIGPQYKMDLTFAAAFCKYYEAAIDMPFVVFQSGNALAPGHEPSSAAFGDFRFSQKIRALSREDWPVGLAVVNTISFPSGDEYSYFGDNGFGADFKVVLDGKVGPVTLATNLGYRLRPAVTVAEVIGPQGSVVYAQKIDDELLYALGVQYDTPLDGLRIMAEFHGATLAKKPFAQRFNNPLFTNVGVAYELPLDMHVGAGAEFGLNPGFGAGLAGYFINFGWAWEKIDADKDTVEDEEDKCPGEIEDLDGFEDEDGCPDPDNDADGIPDADDACPTVAEDRDDFHDADGCPDSDNDADGILDERDACPLAAEDFDRENDEDGCPDTDIDADGIMDISDKCLNEKEDKDGFEDADGCPDNDNDGDGLSDKDDPCPNEAEDKDNFKDDDGCPDPDNDNDGIPDLTDKCPTRPENKNRYQDDDGCPEGRGGRAVKETTAQTTEPAPLIMVSQGQGILILRRQVSFMSGRSLIRRESFVVLNAIADYIKTHPEIGVVEIMVHTSGRGDANANKELSQVRAGMIKTYLGSRGVGSDRIRATGAGDSKPLEAPTTLKARSLNERVEFLTNR